MESIILRPYIQNTYGINDINYPCAIILRPIFTTHIVSMILRPYIHNPYGTHDIKALYSQHIINDIKALYSQPIWYQ